MVGRALVALAMALAFFTAAPGPLTEPAEAAVPFDSELRLYEFENVLVHEAAFVLGSSEEHLKYYFVYEAREDFVTGGLPDTNGEVPDQMGTGFVEVTRFGTDDPICRGPLSDFQDVHVHKQCNDLRVGHSYVLTYQMSLPGTIALWGYHPA